MTNRLDTIVTRQRSTRIRDFAFVVMVAVASVMTFSSVTTAADAANVHTQR